MTMLHYILIALEVVLIFNLIIGAHELGHFLAARWRGLKVERFAIWFGKPIWKKKIGGVEYALGTIPFGGYVSLPQMATMEAIEGKSETTEPLPNVSPLDKIIVAFAGPLFSFLLAVAFAVLVWQVGKPVSTEGNSTVLGWVAPDGPAWKAGLRPGDKILEVDGHSVTQFSPADGSHNSFRSDNSIKWCVITSRGTNIPVKYERDGHVAMAYPVPIHQPTPWYMRKSLRQIMIDSEAPAVVGETLTNSPAAKAGLKPGDEVVAVNGEKIYSYDALLQLEEDLTNGPIKPVTLSVHRGDRKFDVALLAAKPVLPTNAPPSFGIAWQVDTNVSLFHQSPIDQIAASADTIFATLGALFERHGEIGVQQLGGAVMIVRVYYNLFQDDDGWRRVLWFSVVLNVNLALLNLLPLPVLDGGHILLSLIEAVRRRPVSARLLEKIQSGFAALLIAFMLYIAFFDTSDWVHSAHADREVPVIFAPSK
ncbi:MAG TPA: RIP metalloprotease RseP [Candidatus Acidoferrales bacterium]|nr:RIP metalloprotease RseP [Candidatus Acidoferrales bacterium]